MRHAQAKHFLLETAPGGGDEDEEFKAADFGKQVREGYKSDSLGFLADVCVHYAAAIREVVGSISQLSPAGRSGDAPGEAGHRPSDAIAVATEEARRGPGTNTEARLKLLFARKLSTRAGLKPFDGFDALYSLPEPGDDGGNNGSAEIPVSWKNSFSLNDEPLDGKFHKGLSNMRVTVRYNQGRDSLAVDRYSVVGSELTDGVVLSVEEYMERVLHWGAGDGADAEGHSLTEGELPGARRSAALRFGRRVICPLCGLPV